MRQAHRHAPPSRPRPKVTLDQLHTFLAVADTEHVTSAAAALQLSQGSVSAAIGRLEETLGLPLLLRVGRNVRLTDVGRAVRQIGAQVFDQVALIEELATGYLAFERGEIRIAAGRVVGAHQLPAWLAPFVADHRDLAIRLRLAPVHAVLTMLREGDADIVVVGSDVKLAGVETILLDRSELVITVAAQHPLAARPTPMRELQRHRYLAHESGTATRLQADRLLGDDAESMAIIELEEGALHAALIAGIGFGVMQRSAVEAEIHAGRLAVLHHSGRPVMQRVTAARRLAIHPPAVDAMWRHLSGIAQRRRKVSAT
jgi:LysR family transcriptional regulator, low CO2-responsive transcriptional regulator